MLINKKCHAHPLVASDTDPTHPKATADNLMSLAWTADAPLASHTQQSKAHGVTQQCVADTCAQFQKEMHCLQLTACKSATQVFNPTTPPTDALCVWKQTNQSLWHQRLGHPCDECSCNAGQAIKGMPSFKSTTSIFDACPTCIQAKQTKARQQRPTASRVAAPFKPKLHHTKEAMFPHQGMSIDFSFSGMHSSTPNAKTTVKA